MFFSPDFQDGAGISKEIANPARQAIVAESMTEDKTKPITFLHHTIETRAASNAFLQVRSYNRFITQSILIP
jgi:hypothetical protein